MNPLTLQVVEMKTRQRHATAGDGPGAKRARKQQVCSVSPRSNGNHLPSVTAARRPPVEQTELQVGQVGAWGRRRGLADVVVTLMAYSGMWLGFCRGNPWRQERNGVVGLGRCATVGAQSGQRRGRTVGKVEACFRRPDEAGKSGET